MKTWWKIFAGVAVAGAAVAAWAEADWLEWDLSNHTPTASIREAKSYRVFAGLINVEPREFDLAGRHYRINAAWLEHRTEPRRLSVFYTQQQILPELILCVEVTPFDGQTDVWIKGAKLEHIHIGGSNGVRFSEVGLQAPRKFSLCTKDGRSKAEFLVKGSLDVSRHVDGHWLSISSIYYPEKL